MDASFQLYLVMLLAGLILLGAEIYLPGGVVGVIGVLSLVGAMVFGFSAFGPHGGFISAVLIIVLVGLFVILCVRFFPRTKMGKKLTLVQDGKAFKSAPDFTEFMNKEGLAQSDLRPAGIALIDGKRVDVVADGSFIPAKAHVKVTAIEGSRILVRELKNNPLEGASPV